jgi:hypothetical protein
MTTGDVHSKALEGFTGSAQGYARGRPEYPDELSSWLRQSLGLGPGKIVVDLGAGTGKFTELLIRTDATVPRYYKGDWRRVFTGQIVSRSRKDHRV